MELPYVEKEKIPQYIESGKSAAYFLNSVNYFFIRFLLMKELKFVNMH